jgi:outer membrane immunogenic protein
LLPDFRHNGSLLCVFIATDFGGDMDYKSRHAGGLGMPPVLVLNEEIVMKKIFAAMLLASVATTAFAADLPARNSAPPAPVYVAPVFTWTGFYLGVNGGYGWSNFRDNPGSTFPDPKGGLIGGTAGFNYQINQFVVGFEENLDWADLNNSHTLANGISTSSKLESQFTAFGRAGYAIDRSLLFVEGGYAGGELRNTLSDPINGSFSQSNWANGWGIGGGVEYAFTNNITARADYVFSQYQNKNYFAGSPDAVKAGLNVSDIRLGLNYKFW